MTNSSTTFEQYKKLMEPHWKEELVQPAVLLNKSNFFFKKHYEDFALNCLFLNLLDFQIYLVEEVKNNKFFEKSTHNNSEFNNFHFNCPIYDDNYIFRTSENIRYTQNNFFSDVKALKNSKKIQANLLKLFEENPILGYYFWNVTFSNMFGGFFSYKFCNDAKDFLLLFQDNEKAFLQGSLAFIRHNYYFQILFMKSFFVYYQKADNYIQKIQISLMKSIQKLTIQQLEILEIIIDKYPQAFLNEIIIKSIRQWKYSPLFSPTKILFNDEGKCIIIDSLEEIFINDKNHEANIKIFFKPISEAIKLKMTSNEIHLDHLIVNLFYLYPITFLDILIITKIVDNPTSALFFKKNLEHFNSCNIFSKAFYYSFIKRSDLVDIPEKEELDLDMTLVKKWENYQVDCISHNKNPLEFIYNGKLNEDELPFAKVAIMISYNNWKYLDEIKNFLKRETKAFIPFKEIINAQSDFIEILTNHYSSIFFVATDDFISDIKSVYIKNFINVFTKLFSHSFDDEEKYLSEILLLERNIESTKQQQLIEQFNDQITEYKRRSKEEFKKSIEKIKIFIKSDLSTKFNTIFNSNNCEIEIQNEFSYIKKVFRTDYFDNQPPISGMPVIDKLEEACFNQVLKFLKFFVRSNLICEYNKHTIPVHISNETIAMIDLNEIQEELLQRYSFSGIFDYISNFVILLQKQLEYAHSSNNFVGQVFVAVPEINKLLSQFINGQNTPQLLSSLKVGDEVELARMIFGYSFKFRNINSNPQKMTNVFYGFLFAAFDEIKKLIKDVPNLHELYNQFELLLNSLNIDRKNANSESSI